MDTESELSDSSSGSDDESDSSAAQSTVKSNDKKKLLKKYGFAHRNASPLDAETLQPVLKLLIENGGF